MQDDSVRATNDDAAISRFSASSKGYFDDEFASFFLKKRPEKRPPIINRGSFIRFTALNALAISFHNTHVPIQCISFGAGSDTRFFLLASKGFQFSKYIEIDFPQITSKKAFTISKHRELKDLIGEYSVNGGGTEIKSEVYNLISGDLRNLEEIIPKLESVGFDRSKPAIFLSECVMIYLEKQVSDTLVKWSRDYMTSCCLFLTFEQIMPDDAFGRTRNLSLPGIHAYPTLESQRQRYLDAGFSYSYAITMKELFDRSGVETRQRLDKIEKLDEVEEWNLLAEHYCISWGLAGHNGSIESELENVKL